MRTMIVCALLVCAIGCEPERRTEQSIAEDEMEADYNRATGGHISQRAAERNQARATRKALFDLAGVLCPFVALFGVLVTSGLVIVFVVRKSAPKEKATWVQPMRIPTPPPPPRPRSPGSRP